MNPELILKIILENPTVGVDYGLQQGKGRNFIATQKQRGKEVSLLFNCNVKVDVTKDTLPVFLGPFVQGPPTERFIYIDIGTCAGQVNSVWSRRLKIPLKDITKEMILEVLAEPNHQIETIVAGTGKGGGPNCGTVKPFNGWKLIR